VPNRASSSRQSASAGRRLPARCMKSACRNAAQQQHAK
jgi:hypothetical protein